MDLVESDVVAVENESSGEAVPVFGEVVEVGIVNDIANLANDRIENIIFQSESGPCDELGVVSTDLAPQFLLEK